MCKRHDRSMKIDEWSLKAAWLFRFRIIHLAFVFELEIEHVGDGNAGADSSREVLKVSRRYWVQTPNRNFLVEPHLSFLFLHWLPFRVKATNSIHYGMGTGEQDGMGTGEQALPARCGS